MARHLLLAFIFLLAGFAVNAQTSLQGRVTDAESGARAVRAMLDERGLAPDHVIAHSFGGAVASVLADAGITPRAYVSLSAPTEMIAALEELSNAFALAPASYGGQVGF